VGLTKTTYKETGWYNSTYSCRPVVRFYPNTGYAFHSRLYYPNGTTLKDSSIGWPVSAGCIRMLDADINYLYKYLPNGSTVLIY
jgi:lipoprotein-anchoring transpeptidase ErfK/SrfK